MGFTALFGGTFNPFHNGHYEMLKALQNDSNIDEIWLMPDRIPPHKDCDYLPSDSDRISMCELVAKEFSKASVSTVEFEREGRSYSYDTVVEIHKEIIKSNVEGVGKFTQRRVKGRDPYSARCPKMGSETKDKDPFHTITHQ